MRAMRLATGSRCATVVCPTRWLCMRIEVGDWVVVPAGVRSADTGLGFVVDAESVRADGATIETARVRFAGWSPNGSVYSEGNLERVPAAAELGVVFAARLRGLVDDAFMATLFAAWRRWEELGNRGPGLLGRLWERRSSGVEHLLQNVEGTLWPAELADWILNQARDPSTGQEEPAVAQEERPVGQQEPAAAGPDRPLVSGSESDTASEGAVRTIEPEPDWPEVVLTTLGEYDDFECFTLCAGGRSIRILLKGRPLLVRHVAGSVPAGALVDLAWSGRTLRCSRSAARRVRRALTTALAALGVRCRVRLREEQGERTVHWLEGVVIARGEGVPGPPPLPPAPSARGWDPPAARRERRIRDGALPPSPPSVPASVVAGLQMPADAILAESKPLVALARAASGDSD